MFGAFATEDDDQVDPFVCLDRAATHRRPPIVIVRTVPSTRVRILASAAAASIGGRLVGPDVEFDGASFDSRLVRPGQLFIPIVADRNGHEYIETAISAGAAAYLTSQPEHAAEAGTSIEVDDTAVALMALAAWARSQSVGKVIGVTGSVGKTSTKDLIAAACASGLRTAANERSFNNEQGLPITVLNAPDDTEVLVLEMGMRGFGEITRLCDVAQPDIGVVTAVGHSHTERVGGIEGVAKAKKELVEALDASGTAILNADDERVLAMARHAHATVLTYGTSADVRLSGLELDALARPRFRVDTPWGNADVELATSGAHMASNAAAAIAVAGSVGVSLNAAVGALATASISGMRMEVSTAPSGATVINDAYNANPTSMGAALEALAAMEADRRIAILGLMGELDDDVEGHREVARIAETLGVQVVATGTDLYGVRPTDDPVAFIGNFQAGDVVLVKASRSAGLERVVNELLN
jgi:UDP-N-acetylmuramoyl-tripeptide--D-alanyl-D-alanine ligase